MSADNDKARAFVSRLMANPAMNGYTPLQKEEQIIQFLHVNGPTLYPTLASAAFFPGKDWNTIFSLLLTSLYGIVDESLNPNLDRLIKDKINFRFISFLRQQNIDNDSIQSLLRDSIIQLLKKPEVRRAFTGAHAALEFNAVDRYIDQIFYEKSYVHFELTKVQRLQMSKDEIKHMIKGSLLTRALIFSLGGESILPSRDKMTTLVNTNYADMVLNTVSSRMKLLPPELLRSGLYSCISFMENRNIDATARIAAILSARCKGYKPGLKVDRGADSPDKSWLNIARRNYKFYGFDIKMLDEFYRIAAQNAW